MWVLGSSGGRVERHWERSRSRANVRNVRFHLIANLSGQSKLSDIADRSRRLFRCSLSCDRRHSSMTGVRRIAVRI